MVASRSAPDVTLFDDSMQRPGNNLAPPQLARHGACARMPANLSAVGAVSFLQGRSASSLVVTLCP
jgi:hypothetical protein